MCGIFTFIWLNFIVFRSKSQNNICPSISSFFPRYHFGATKMKQTTTHQLLGFLLGQLLQKTKVTNVPAISMYISWRSRKIHTVRGFHKFGCNQKNNIYIYYIYICVFQINPSFLEGKKNIPLRISIFSSPQGEVPPQLVLLGQQPHLIWEIIWFTSAMVQTDGSDEVLTSWANNFHCSLISEFGVKQEDMTLRNRALDDWIGSGPKHKPVIDLDSTKNGSILYQFILLIAVFKYIQIYI